MDDDDGDPATGDHGYVALTKGHYLPLRRHLRLSVWVLNALAGYVYLHSASPTADANLIYQGSAGDIDYYIIDDDIVPLLLPLETIGVPHFVLSALVPLRVLIETAYRRDLGPGVPVHASLLPHVNPSTVTANLIKSIPVGIDDATEELGLGRRLGTTPPGPYGVGVPHFVLSAPVAAMSASTATEPTAAKNDSEPQVGAHNQADAKDESAQENTAPAASTTSEDEAVKPDTKKSETRKADRPKLRGLIQFDFRRKKPKESSSSASDEPSTTAQTSATKTDSTAASHPTGSSESESKAAA